MTHTKTCTKCKEEKPIECFSDNETRKYSWCKACINVVSKRCYENNKEHHIAQGLITRRKFMETSAGRSSRLVIAARGRAKHSGIPFTITKEWLSPKMDLGVCEVTGIKLDLSAVPGGSGIRPPFGPSLDQILPGMGYTPENTQLVCWMYNCAKGTHSHEDVITFAKAVAYVN